jgi:adenylate cyclase
VSTADVGEAKVPATLQATIAARIDRLDPKAKRTLSAAAVIGSRFSLELLETLGIEPILEDLVVAELIDQVTFTRQPEYVFHHPLIRAVAYEAQLKSDRAELHRRVAAAIESGDPAAAEENAALIAEHLEAAGDLHAAYGWHMRAATWATNRDISAAHTSWRRARQVADRLPEDDPDRASMRIAPRTLLCGMAFRLGLDPGFDELRDLCAAAGDQRSLAIGMAGLVMAKNMNAHCREASRLSVELVRLLDSVGDPMLTVGLSFAAMAPKHETAEMAEVLRLAQRVIDLADRDPTTGNMIFASPLTLATAMRGIARASLGIAGWKDDIHEAITATAGARFPAQHLGPNWYAYVIATAYGVLLPDDTAIRDTAELSAWSKKFGDDLGVDIAGITRAVTLLYQDGLEREDGVALLTAERLNLPLYRPVLDIHIAREMASHGDLDGAIELGRTVVGHVFTSGGRIWTAPATDVLVESLLRRASNADLREARAHIHRLAAVPSEPGFVLRDIWLLRLRALLARAQGDTVAYTHFRDRYRDMAKTLGFEGHMAWAEEMP